MSSNWCESNVFEQVPCDILHFGKKVMNCNSLIKAIRKETLGFSNGDGRATGKRIAVVFK